MTFSNSSSARVSARRAAASSARGEQIGELTPGRACNAVGENLHSHLDRSQTAMTNRPPAMTIPMEELAVLSYDVHSPSDDLITF